MKCTYNTLLHKCENIKYEKYEECILHCSKEKLSSLGNPYFKDCKAFFNTLVEYIHEQYFEKDNISLEDLKVYFKLNDDDEIELIKSNKDVKHNSTDFADPLENEKYIMECIQAKNIVFTKINFPNYDKGNKQNYKMILEKLNKIHFNYCNFHVPHLDLNETECFFQDCEFFEYWSLFDYKQSKDGTEEIYQQCIFHESVMCAPPKNERKKLTNSQFNGCIFENELILENVDIEKPLFCDWIGFEHKNDMRLLKIENCVFDSKFTMIKYKINEISLKDTQFNKKFELRECICENSLSIDNCNFEKLSGFYGGDFKKFKILKSIFSDYTGFEDCKFGIDKEAKEHIVSFKYVTFLSLANFRNTYFKSGLELENTNLKESPSFLNATIEFKNTSRETFRIIKHSFDKVGNYIEANKYFACEMRKHKEELENDNDKKSEKLIFWFNAAISDFGQSYIKPIVIFLISAIVHFGIFFIVNIDYKYEIPSYITQSFKHLNYFVDSIIPFKTLLKKDLGFISMLFSIWYSTLIWHILVAIKRHIKR